MKRVLTNSMLYSAEKYPDHISFSQNETKISYSELVSRSCRLANFLLSLGVQKGDRIGICMNRSIESSYSVYGILLCGAIYVPIDSRLPKQRIAAMVSDCEMKIIISQSQYSNKIQEIITSNANLEFILGLKGIENNHNIQTFSWSDMFTSEDTLPKTMISEDDPAYIIYTSGTTGNPKGILHTHYSGYSYAKLSAELYQLNHSDILGNHSHLHYDISTLGYLTMPYVGGHTVIISEAHTIFPINLAALIEKEKMTIWYSVPLALIQLLHTNALGNHDYGQLRWVLFGGESFDKTYLDSLFDYFPKATFSNVYGPAEVNQCSYYNFDSTTALANPIPIGKPWAETSFRINNNSKHQNVGELWVSSSTQMQGYWNREELNKQCFETIKDENGDSKRYYKTGDLVEQIAQDEFVFIGRSDRQIKLRGHRVEMNEIEMNILNIASIQEVAVYSKKGEDDQNKIYANVISNEVDLTEKKIINILNKTLPPQAIPTEIRIVETIPRTAAGKVDYKTLSE